MFGLSGEWGRSAGRPGTAAVPPFTHQSAHRSGVPPTHVRSLTLRTDTGPPPVLGEGSSRHVGVCRPRRKQ